MKTAAQMAANWQAAMSSPTTASKYKQGIQGFQGNPMQLAATPAALALYQQNCAASVTSGRRANALNAVPVSRWQNNAANSGSINLTAGAQRAMDKVTAHFNAWAAIYQQASQAAQALPRGGEANALARVQAAMRVMMQAAGTSH